MNARTIGSALAAVSVALMCLTGCVTKDVDDVPPESRRFEVAGDHVTITGDSGQVDLTPADVDDVEVTRWFTGDSDEATWQMSSDELRLSTDCGFLSSCDVRYEIRVPHNLEVTATGDSSDIKASGFDTTVNVETDNGSIVLDEMTGDLTIVSSSGNQTLSGITSTNIDTKAENGQIEIALDSPAESLRVETQNGDVSVEAPEAGYALTTDTENGSIDNELNNDSASNNTIDIATENGKITLASR